MKKLITIISLVTTLVSIVNIGDIRYVKAAQNNSEKIEIKEDTTELKLITKNSICIKVRDIESSIT